MPCFIWPGDERRVCLGWFLPPTMMASRFTPFLRCTHLVGSSVVHCCILDTYDSLPVGCAKDVLMVQSYLPLLSTAHEVSSLVTAIRVPFHQRIIRFCPTLDRASILQQ